jgi:hypothetical protein
MDMDMDIDIDMYTGHSGAPLRLSRTWYQPPIYQPLHEPKECCYILVEADLSIA